MARQYFYRQGATISGPISVSQIKELAARGVISAVDCIRDADSDKWVEVGKIKGLFSSISAGPKVSTVGPPPVLATEPTPGALPKATNNERKMSPFIRDSCVDGEDILNVAELHKMMFAPSMFFAAIGFLGLPFILLGLIPTYQVMFVIAVTITGCSMVVALLLSAAPLESYFTTEFALTTRRIVGKTGFTNRVTIELLLKQIESIQVHQSLFGRFFNYGTLIVTGTGASNCKFPGIAAPNEFRKRIQAQVVNIQSGKQ